MGIAVVTLMAVVAVGAVTTHYFDAKGLDPRPYPLHGIELDAAQERAASSTTASCSLDVYIDADGVVDHVDAAQSRCRTKFRDEAVRAFSEVRWEPGRKVGDSREEREARRSGPATAAGRRCAGGRTLGVLDALGQRERDVLVDAFQLVHAAHAERLQAA